MSRIQLHLVSQDAVTPISIDVKCIAYFHAVFHAWSENASSELLINSRIITVKESFQEIAQRIAEALAPNEPWRAE